MTTRRKVVAAGASVWLVDEMVHAKAVVINTELALAGSANMDERSPFLNYELVTAFFRTADVHRFDCWIEQQRAASRLYRAKSPSPMAEFSEGLIRWLAL